MFVKYALGRGFKGLVKYQFKEERSKPARIIASNIPSEREQDIIGSFVDVASQRPRVAKPVVHAIVAWHPDDQVDDATMAVVARRLLDAVDLPEDQFQFVAFRHDDTDSPHMHLIANRISFDGEAQPNRDRPGLRMRDEATRLDVEYGFTTGQRALTKGQERGVIGPTTAVGRPSSREVYDAIPLTKFSEREGMRAAKHEVYTGVREALAACDGSFEDLDFLVRKQGIAPAWSFTSAGGFNGASFTLLNAAGTDPLLDTGEGVDEGRTFTFKGSQLGPRPGMSKDYILKAMDARKASVERAQGRKADRDAMKAQRAAEARQRADSFRAHGDRRRFIVGSTVTRLARDFGAYRFAIPHGGVFSIAKILQQDRAPRVALRRPPTPKRAKR